VAALVQSVSEMDIWGGSGDGSVAAPASAEDDEGDGELELQSVSGETYEAVFPFETKLGMLLERCDEPSPPGKGPGKGAKGQERTLVKMVIEGGAAEMRGVQVGSKLVALNGQKVNAGKTYLETLELVKTLPRPLTVVMEKVRNFPRETFPL
jgi:hypothetical protein